MKIECLSKLAFILMLLRYPNSNSKGLIHLTGEFLDKIRLLKQKGR